MGWMGWTEAETLDTTMAAILAAYEGRIEMLKAIFGAGDGGRDKPPATPATGRSLRNALRMLAGGKKAR